MSCNACKTTRGSYFQIYYLRSFSPSSLFTSFLFPLLSPSLIFLHLSLFFPSSFSFPPILPLSYFPLLSSPLLSPSLLFLPLSLFSLLFLSSFTSILFSLFLSSLFFFPLLFHLPSFSLSFLLPCSLFTSSFTFLPLSLFSLHPLLSPSLRSRIIVLNLLPSSS
uniref:Uncharacterized protein n=1 Tax=Cacopsylla melanoneura TaxID=428564 RepID=A0A8D8XJJ9_9HEMI